jgi:hypothetical protein
VEYRRLRDCTCDCGMRILTELGQQGAFLKPRRAVAPRKGSCVFIVFSGTHAKVDLIISNKGELARSARGTSDRICPIKALLGRLMFLKEEKIC